MNGIQPNSTHVERDAETLIWSASFIKCRVCELTQRCKTIWNVRFFFAYEILSVNVDSFFFRFAVCSRVLFILIALKLWFYSNLRTFWKLNESKLILKYVLKHTKIVFTPLSGKHMRDVIKRKYTSWMIWVVNFSSFDSIEYVYLHA